MHCRGFLRLILKIIKHYSQTFIAKQLALYRIPFSFEVIFDDIQIHMTRLAQFLKRASHNEDPSIKYVLIENDYVPTDSRGGEQILQMLCFALKIKNSLDILLLDNYQDKETVKFREHMDNLFLICINIVEDMFDPERFDNKARRYLPVSSQQKDFIKFLKTDKTYFLEFKKLHPKIVRAIKNNKKLTEAQNNHKQIVLKKNFNLLQNFWRKSLHLNKAFAPTRAVQDDALIGPLNWRTRIESILQLSR